MIIEQTIEVPADRRVFFEFLAPKEIPAGLARVQLKVTPISGKQDEFSRENDKDSPSSISDMFPDILSDKPTPRADRLLGIAANLGEINLYDIRDERLAKH